MFNNEGQQSDLNVGNNSYYQNNNVGQSNNFNGTMTGNSSENNNLDQQSINQYNVPNIESSNNNLNQNKFKFVVVFAIVVVILFVCIMLFIGIKNVSTVEQGQNLKIKNSFTNITLKVESVERNVKLLNSLSNEFESFTKIKINILNNTDQEYDIMILNNFDLLDEDKKDVSDSSCFNEIWSFGRYEVSDYISSEVSPKSTTSGYIYCRDEKNTGKILEITSYTSFDEELLEQGRLKSTDFDVFYVSLK